MTTSQTVSVNPSPSKLLTPSISSLPLQGFTPSSTMAPSYTQNVYKSYSVMTTGVLVVKPNNVPQSSINDNKNVYLLLIGVPIIIISLLCIITIIHRKKPRQIQQPQNIIIVQNPAWVNENPVRVRQNPPELNV